MLLSPNSLWSIEILLTTIWNQYLKDSYCLSMVSESPLDFPISNSFTYITPGDGNSLVNRLLEVSEMGCSDYIVKMRDPAKFMVAFEKVNHLGNVRRSDRKVLLLPHEEDNITRTNLLDILSMHETSFLANILLVLPVPDPALLLCSVYDLVTHKYVGSNDHVDEPHYLDRWNSCSSKFENNVDLFPHDLTNLYGKTVKVACFTYKPYVLLDLDPSVEPLGRDGTEVRIVDEFCRWINCSIEIIRDDEHEWGELFENDTGVGVLGNVAEDRADLGITALYSWYEEYRALDFSVPGIRTAITCVAPSPRLLASWEMPLLPFSWYMWLSLVFTFVYASLALIVAKGFSTDKVFLTTFGMMITQADVGGTWRIRSITGWLLLAGLVLDNAYSGGLASVFTVPKYEKSIDTVQDIVDRELDWGATHDAWVFSLTLSSEPIVKKLVSQFRVSSAEIMKKRSRQRNMAFSIERLPAGYFAIGDYITKESMLDLTLMREDFYYELCVVMMRKSSPYTQKISDLIGRLHESGLMLAWETQVALKYLNYEVQLEVRLSRFHKDVENIEPLNFRHVVGVFILYAVGVMMSTLLFILEIVVHKKQRSILALQQRY